MSRRTSENYYNSLIAMLMLVTFIGVQVQIVFAGDIADAIGNYVTVTLDGRHRIRGQTEYTIYENRPFAAFRGVPFAETPVGRLRFKPPVPKNLPHSLDAFTYGSVCSQLRSGLLHGSEDCLFLNVFTPAITPHRKLAVIVFIPGGGYVTGGIDDDYYGPDFLVEQDVVMVSMNYRINAFGLMSLGNEEYAGQMAFQDQQLAMRWVQRHIHQFGGDAENVTLMGSSAGGASVHFHMLSASSKGLFQRAILMSGSAGNVWAVSSHADHRQQMMDLAKKHNSSVDTFADLVDWLHGARPLLLLESDNLNFNIELADPNYEFPWAPVVANGSAGQQFVVQNDLRQVFSYASDVDVLIGHNSDEMVATIGPFLGVPSLFEKLDNNFTIYLPFRSWQECRNKTAYAEAMREIRHFYFGDAHVDASSFPQLNAMLSDIQFNYGVDQSVRHHVAHSSAQTYFYRISANTTLNIFKRESNVMSLLLTSHVDEICYIFKCLVFPNIYDNLLPESTERQVQTHLLNLWTNFAKFGQPTPSGFPLDFPATTADNYRLVGIGNEGVTEVANPNWQATQFWDSLYERYSAHFEVPC